MARLQDNYSPDIPMLAHRLGTRRSFFFSFFCRGISPTRETAGGAKKQIRRSAERDPRNFAGGGQRTFRERARARDKRYKSSCRASRGALLHKVHGNLQWPEVFMTAARNDSRTNYRGHLDNYDRPFNRRRVTA